MPAITSYTSSSNFSSESNGRSNQSASKTTVNIESAFSKDYKTSILFTRETTSNGANSSSLIPGDPQYKIAFTGVTAEGRSYSLTYNYTPSGTFENGNFIGDIDFSKGTASLDSYVELYEPSSGVYQLDSYYFEPVGSGSGGNTALSIPASYIVREKDSKIIDLSKANDFVQSQFGSFTKTKTSTGFEFTLETSDIRGKAFINFEDNGNVITLGSTGTNSRTNISSDSRETVRLLDSNSLISKELLALSFNGLSKNFLPNLSPLVNGDIFTTFLTNIGFSKFYGDLYNEFFGNKKQIPTGAVIQLSASQTNSGPGVNFSSNITSSSIGSLGLPQRFERNDSQLRSSSSTTLDVTYGDPGKDNLGTFASNDLADFELLLQKLYENGTSTLSTVGPTKPISNWDSYQSFSSKARDGDNPNPSTPPNQPPTSTTDKLTTTAKVDVLAGESNVADTFKFSATPAFGKDNADRITNFVSKGKLADTLAISKNAFGISASRATLAVVKNQKNFDKAAASTSLFVYDTRDGGLYFNADGTTPGFGGDRGGLFAILDNKPKLTTANIALVS